MSHLHFKFLSLKCEVTIMSLEWVLRCDKVVSESINKFDMKVYLEPVWQWFSKVFLLLKTLLSAFGMKIRCLVNFKKHFKILKYSKNAPKWFPIPHFPFHSYLSPSFSSIALYLRLHSRKGATLSFDDIDLIEGNSLFFSCFSFPCF